MDRQSWLATWDTLSWMAVILVIGAGGVILSGIWRIFAHTRAHTRALLVLQDRPQDGHYDWEHMNPQERKKTLAVERQLQRDLERLDGQHSLYDMWVEGIKQRFSLNQRRRVVHDHAKLAGSMVTASEQVNRLLRSKSVRESMDLEHNLRTTNLEADIEEAQTRKWQAQQQRKRKRTATGPGGGKKTETDTFMGDLDDNED